MLYYITENGYSEISTGAVIAVLAAILAITVAFYVLRGLGLYKLAKRYGLKYPILAWFPFTWFYVAGLLLGNVALFGKKFDKFALVAFIVFTVSGVFYNAIRLISYIPVAGFFLQGGTTYLSYSTKYLAGCTVFDTSFGYVGLINFNDPYSDTLWKVLNVMAYVSRWISIVSLFFTVIIYSNFFRSFLPNHYFIATIFSVLFSSIGLFGLWAFVVRNNERVNYADYMRSRYAAFYGVGRGYGDGGNGGAYPPPRSDSGENDDDPFEETDGEHKEKGGFDDPFGEFDEKNKK